MSPEALALGALSAVRVVPMTIASALLLSERPRWLIAVYVAAGVAVSLIAGVTAVVVFEADAGSREQGTGRTVVDLLLGVLALGFAVAYGAGWIGGGSPSSDDGRRDLLSGPGPLGWIGERLRHPTVSGVAAAGVLTNLPGLYFLAGLVAILATQPTLVGGVVQVGVYTLLRFGGPLAVLVLVVLRPRDTVRTVQRLHAWGRRNRRALVAGVLGAVGAYLVVESLVALL